MLLLLSHLLAETDTPYPGAPPSLRIRPVRRIAGGDPCNTSLLELFNHAGTHMDAPNHFVEHGRTLADFPAGSFFFESPLMIDVPAGDGEAIRAEALEGCTALGECDLLLIRTGYGRFRATEPSRFVAKHPGLSVEAARFLLKECGRLRALGIDVPSIGPSLDRTERIQVHRELLGAPGRDLLIIEDMRLDRHVETITSVLALPLLARGVDSAPCTVVATVPNGAVARVPHVAVATVPDGPSIRSGE